MARQTPEGKVKNKIITLLKKLGCFYYMPVQNGTGVSGIPDIMVIMNGVPICIECKATAKNDPTINQAFQLEKIHNSGGIAWVVDDENVEECCNLLAHFDDTEDYMALRRINSHAFRWTKKLEVMEFGDGDDS